MGVAKLSAGRVAWARGAEAMSRLGNYSDFVLNLESLVLPDSQVHPFYTPSSRPIFGDVRRCSTMFGDVRRCSAMFVDIIRASS